MRALEGISRHGLSGIGSSAGFNNPWYSVSSSPEDRQISIHMAQRASVPTQATVIAAPLTLVEVAMATIRPTSPTVRAPSNVLIHHWEKARRRASFNSLRKSASSLGFLPLVWEFLARFFRLLIDSPVQAAFWKRQNHASLPLMARTAMY